MINAKESGEKGKFRIRNGILNSLSIFLIILVIISGLFLYDIFIQNHTLILEKPNEVTIENKYMIRQWIIDSKKFVAIPVGRPIQNMKEISVFMNSNPINPIHTYDGCGGYWLNLSLDLFTGDTEIIVEFENKIGLVPPFKDSNENLTQWISPSQYIDSNNSTIMELTYNMTNKESGITNKVNLIYDFVNKQIKNEEHSSNEFENASQVYQLGYGVCRHKSRLFVAMCRSVNIPARTIMGLLAYDSVLQDNVHLWAEYRDENGLWYQVDPSNDLEEIRDPRYFDYIYAGVQNFFWDLTLDNGSMASMSDFYSKSSLEEVGVRILPFPVKISIPNYLILSLVCFLISIGGTVTLNWKGVKSRFKRI